MHGRFDRERVRFASARPGFDQQGARFDREGVRFESARPGFDSLLEWFDQEGVGFDSLLGMFDREDAGFAWLKLELQIIDSQRRADTQVRPDQ